MINNESPVINNIHNRLTFIQICINDINFQ